MSINIEKIKRLIRDHLPGSSSHIRVSPYRSYYLYVYAPKFQGKPYKKQEQMVLDVLKKGDIGINPHEIKIDTRVLEGQFIQLL